ncbi:MAG TPA: ParA family protein [Micropepsaceae bacterium]|nr:ParA family protein [Micropepsaceae bacterium]
MIVIAIACQKGGSGKTTLSGHLAVEAEKAGAGPVTLIDTDPQGSLSNWWNARGAKTPNFAKFGPLELEAGLAELSRTGTRIAIIDTPPAISDSIMMVIEHADLVIVPIRPSPHDLHAVAATVDMVDRFEKPLIFVINGATQRARITGEAAVALSQHGVVAPVNLHHRVDFAASMIDGRTVGEAVPKSPSSKEMADLWTYIQGRLARLVKDASLVPAFPQPQFPLAGITGVTAPEIDEGPEISGSELPVLLANPMSPDAPTPNSNADSIPGSAQIAGNTGEQPRAELQQQNPARALAIFGRPQPAAKTFGRRQRLAG